MQQRSSFAITTLILSATSSAHDKGISKTKLMQQVMLNLPRANRYLSRLQAKELIEYDSKTRKYKITPRGREVLKLCEEVALYIAPIENLILRYRRFFYEEGDNLNAPFPSSRSAQLTQSVRQ